MKKIIFTMLVLLNYCSINATEMELIGYAGFKLGMTDSDAIVVMKKYLENGWQIFDYVSKYENSTSIKTGYLLENTDLNQEMTIEFTEGQSGLLSRVYFREVFQSIIDAEEKTEDIKAILITKYGKDKKKPGCLFWYPQKNITIQLTPGTPGNERLILWYSHNDLLKQRDKYVSNIVAKMKALRYDQEKDQY